MHKNRLISSDEGIWSHLQIDDLRIRVRSRAVHNLAVDLLLETPFKDKYIQGIFPEERKLVPSYSKLVDKIISTTKTANVTAVEDHKDSQHPSAFLADDIYLSAVVAKAVTLVPLAHTPVSVKRTGLESRIIKHIDNSTSRAPLHVA